MTPVASPGAGKHRDDRVECARAIRGKWPWSIHRQEELRRSRAGRAVSPCFRRACSRSGWSCTGSPRFPRPWRSISSSWAQRASSWRCWSRWSPSCRSGARGYAGSGSAALGVLLPLAHPGVAAHLRAGHPEPAAASTTSRPTPARRQPSRRSPSSARADANPAAYPGERVAAVQQKAYPDLRTFIIDRSVEEAFELVEETVRKLRWRVVPPRPAGRRGRPRAARSKPPTNDGGRLHRRHRRPRGWQRQPLAHRCALGLALRSGRPRTRTPRGCGASSASCRRGRTRRCRQPWPDAVDCAPRAPAHFSRRLKARDQQKAESRTARDRVQSSAQRGRGQKETQR